MAGPHYPEVIVVGAGVIGLTSARRLQQAGHRVTVVAEATGTATTSVRAAAVWLPYRAEPLERVGEWAYTTYRVCRTEVRKGAAAVRFVPLRQYSREAIQEPFWRRPDIPFRRLGDDDLPAGYRDGWEAEVPFFDAPRFLDRLVREFRAAGGRLVERRVGSLAEAAEIAGLSAEGVVVHCAGLGARDTVGDDTMFPIRGHTVMVRPAAPLAHAVDDDQADAPAYVLPRSRDEVILGGTAQVGDGRTEGDAEERRAILERCRPLLAPIVDDGRSSPGDLEVVASVVGLRPGRPEVRLEVEEGAAGGRPVIHNYGHGGSGFTVCWGCAEEVVNRAAWL